MDLTICLITKGRAEYIDQLLDSLDPVLEHDWVKILIVLNGANLEFKTKIESWAVGKAAVLVEYRIENESRPSYLWTSIRKHVASWCTFISDDDVFNYEIINEIKNVFALNSKLVGIATSVEIIDSIGNVTGEIRNPTYNTDISSGKSFARAIHEPCFPWPSLYFDVNALPDVLPNTRYVFDWWVCLQLLMSGEVATIRNPGIKYRVHNGQESSIAANKRKYLEALIWFIRLVESEEFKTWIIGLSQSDQLDFWREIHKVKPIYGNSVFSNVLTFSIAEAMTPLVNNDLKVEILNKMAFSNGVLLKRDESIYFTNGLSLKNNMSNFRVEFVDGTCSLVTSLSVYFSETDGLDLVKCYCKHSTTQQAGYLIDCDSINSADTDLRSDILTMQLMDSMESEGFFEFTFTPIEIALVKFYRKLKNKLPLKLLGKARKYFRSKIKAEFN
jgi:hypothetical protein